MQLTMILLTAGFLQVSAAGLSQSVTFKGTDVPLKQVLVEVEKQTGYAFFATEAMLKDAKSISVDVTNEPLKSFLEKILSDEFEFSIRNKNIILKERKRNLSPLISDESVTPIKGVVRDAEGNPLGGINIVIKGTKRGVVTDAYGNFMIDAKEGEVLIISSVSYAAREIK
ncbi:MAG: carboxypeptidase-like regulatory domain-containing protein, partial [Chitinophagaceae bacterium]|nr:carboxypeptidase-like regulatory domain-containing protein [Chitinophagaceae bacterium]